MADHTPLRSTSRFLHRCAGKRATYYALTALSRLGIIQQPLKTYYVLSTDPIVIYIGNVMDNLFDISELLCDQKVYYVKNFYHQHITEDRLSPLESAFDEFKRRFPMHHIHFMCATQAECEIFKQRNLAPATFCNKNCLIDENMFQIIPGEEKIYDAIYNAHLASYKRHELAASIKSLALLTYRHPGLPKTDSYVEETRALLAHGDWINDRTGMVPPQDVGTYLNRARVGLCLSEEEGAMAASVEYLLCGIPVISTRSIGGREVFFDDAYSQIVNDTPEAVATGVQEIIDRDLDPVDVRSRLLHKLQEHRYRFINIVQSIYDEEKTDRDFSKEFPNLFCNKLRVSSPFPGALYRYLSRGMPVATARNLVATGLQ